VIPVAFVGSILALLVSVETWNVSSLVGLIGLFGIAVQNGLVLVTQTRALLAEGKPLREAIREASIGRVRPKLMTASTAICGLLPILLLRMHDTEIERPLAIVNDRRLGDFDGFHSALVLPTIYPWFTRRAMRNGSPYDQ
jgi:cobalt-zinc-cadmium resistance protein CzcA